jgi:hypothetical protein
MPKRNVGIFRPFSILNPLRGCNSDSAQYANTPSPRFFEDEDDDENEYDSKRLVRASRCVGLYQGLKPLGKSSSPFRTKSCHTPLRAVTQRSSTNH